MKRLKGLLSWGPIAAVALLFSVSPAALAQNTVPFSVNAPGVTKAVVEWGIDTALYYHDQNRQSVANMGAANIDVVRLTFNPVEPLIANPGGGYSLNQVNKDAINFQLGLASLAGTKPLSLLPGNFGPVYDTLQWERTIKATQEYINSRPGWGATPIVAIEAFNEPDFWQGEGSPADFNNLIARLKTYPEFQNTEFPAASTLNSNNARWWYDQIPQATQGSSHLLGGTMTSYVNFMDYVKSTGKEFVNPELHSLGEAIIGAEHGMTSGVWWADALRARGLFVQASDGKRLGYHEDLQRQSAAAVYRAPDGEVYAFAGGVERFGAATSYRFVSDEDVWFNGIRVREYVLQTKFDEFFADDTTDFTRYGSWSNQGAYADIDTDGSGVPALDGYRWKIVNAETGRLMEVVNGVTSDGGLIQASVADGDINQLWNITRTRNGYYHLYNANSGRTAEVAGQSLDNGADVRQWGTADNAGQQWYVKTAGDGAFYLRNAHSHKLLTAAAGGRGTSNVLQDAQLGLQRQKWKFVLATPDPEDVIEARYAFDSNGQDGVGSNHATLVGGPSYVAGRISQALNFDGVNDYATLPAGIADAKDLTIAAWVKWDGGAAWQRVFDFGDDTANNFFLTPRSGAGTMRLAITTGGNANEQFLETAALPTGEWVHLAVTLGGNTGILYVNGVPQVAGQILINPSDFNPVNNYLGKSQYADPLFDGQIDGFTVYHSALDARQIAQLVRPGDFNGDGLVDASDYTVLRDGIGVTYYESDFQRWRDNYGANYNTSLATSVPEPAAILMAAIALAAVSKRR
jgi:hypothetical protein